MPPGGVKKNLRVSHGYITASRSRKFTHAETESSPGVTLLDMFGTSVIPELFGSDGAQVLSQRTPAGKYRGRSGLRGRISAVFGTIFSARPVSSAEIDAPIV
jgi:hypothetical protein